MAIELNVPVVLALQERLADELPAVIAAVNAERQDAGELVMPSEILTYIPPPSDRLDPPVIGIGDAPGRFEDDNGFSATGVHEQLVVVYEQSSDQADLTWQLRWWSVALARVVLADRNLGDAAWGTVLRPTRPGPTLVDDPDNPQDWFSWTGVVIQAKRDEE